VIFAGTGVERAGARDALVALAEQLGCPVIPSLAGRSVIAHDHPLCFMSQSPAADALRRAADLVLAVGTRLGNLDVPYDKYWGPSDPQRLIQIDIDPRHIGVSRPVGIGMVADARQALEALADALAGKPLVSRGRGDLSLCRAEDAAWRQSLLGAVQSWQGPGIHPAHALGMVGAEFGRDAVYCTDGGMTSLWASLALPSAKANSYHGIMEIGMLGVGIPAAVGAKFAAPAREVVCVTGDGAAGFNVMELQVAAREELKITVVVMAEGQWTMEIPNEMARWGRTFQTAMGEVRWDKLAESLGCHGEHVETLAHLPAALQRARAADRPALVCVRTSVEANVAIPPSVAGRFFEVYFGPGS
jgi:acetolactate synthase-1/2/3 large subunit